MVGKHKKVHSFGSNAPFVMKSKSKRGTVPSGITNIPAISRSLMTNRNHIETPIRTIKEKSIRNFFLLGLMKFFMFTKCTKGFTIPLGS